MKGIQRGYATAAAIRQLADLFTSSNYFSLQPSYGDCGGDLSSTITSIEWAGFKKEVKNCGGFAGAIPQKLWDLELAIDVTAGSQQWIGTDKERMTY